MHANPSVNELTEKLKVIKTKASQEEEELGALLHPTEAHQITIKPAKLLTMNIEGRHILLSEHKVDEEAPWDVMLQERFKAIRQLEADEPTRMQCLVE
jgi:hypothetical protein